MPEVEALGLVDGAAEPVREVGEVDAPSAVAVLRFQESLKVLVFDGLRCAEVVQKVFDGHYTVEVFVQGEERLPEGPQVP